MQHLDCDYDYILYLFLDSDDTHTRFKCLTEEDFNHELSLDPTLFTIRLPYGAGFLYYEDDIVGQHILKYVQFKLNLSYDDVHPTEKWW